MVENSTDRGSNARLGEFLEIVDTLRDVPPITARPEFVAELREQLLDEARVAARTSKGAETAARLTITRSAPSRRRERRLAAAIGGLAIIGATTGMAVASQSALPGDPLYPLKRAIENAQTGVQFDEDAKGKTLLDNASGRLEEVDQLSREDDDADDHLRDPADLHRPGQRGLRAAALRLRRDRPGRLGRGAPRLHRRQHDDAHRPRGRRSRGRAALADQGRSDAGPDRRAGADRLPVLRPGR